ncbi:MAG: hypothetical protein HY958_05050 [Bacteroidia bacterium]|nr:hypothetical protein [Bacteroidia bacterium]
MTEECIKEALKYFELKIQETLQKMIDTKEEEKIGKYNTVVASEGNPAEDIAKTTMSLVEQVIYNYSKVEQFIKIQELLNDEFITNKQGQEKTIYREIEKIWIYPVPGDNNNYTLTLIAKFKIKK